MVEQLIGHRGPELGAGLGERLPFHAGSAGHVMLAFGPPELLDRVLAEPRTVYTDRTPVDEAELRRIVRDVRRTSVSIAEGHIVPTTASISAPVFGAEGAFVGAVSLVAEVGTVDLQALAPRVLHTARQISAALHTDPPATVRPLRRLRARRAG
jgi:DNA-binding IclR family transcriptional regulator